MSALFAWQGSRFPVKQTALTGSAGNALCNIGNMDQRFSHVNAHYVVVRLLCWFLVRLH
ncbi:hypothetical protein SLEP1_g20693 [Rubroshorea leprosula]|uniref:Uncharacterized protein n=1 Tax=Rubroshorea leprosula TaxID=152421 RepID=A0AAV5JCI9_9ROSI|nr:hypothetical protein SLEP1_g20693 [Rubroshorea leprosula]